MRALKLGLVVVCIAASQAAGAESASQAITTFGLDGTCAPDCASENERFTFALSTFGSPTMMEKQFMSSAPTAKPNMIRSEIKSAVRLTEEKLRVVAAVTNVNGNAMPADSAVSKPVELLFQKVQNKLVVNNRLVFEKCLN
jgi:hypothetical protein